MDDTYQIYVNRVAQMTLSASYAQQLQNIQKSAKFDGGVAVPFPGYTVMTPPEPEDPVNSEFYNYLKLCQGELLQHLPPGLLVPIPPASFHVTLADLIWDGGYRDAVGKNPQFEQELFAHISESFRQYQAGMETSKPIILQLLGLSIFRRALAVCLVPAKEEGYGQIVGLRRSIYQNSGIISLGIDQQYDYTAHVTLGYFGEIAPQLNRESLGRTLGRLNDSWLETEPPVISIERAQIRKFTDMLNYEREGDWPVCAL
ncbi:MAG: DUF1868 domain-containing protein [Gomphosphaeria aponina SAG 52.96 = DSM 107014]|uniref:DUF1868 domain-containing protein n=1 Tax=Gomphosphaeria aponina SAG 52.96 = DSM 107014 TaxID=1521640 RepID=A0A941GVH4_9CHRO|nr:DUF1868 domain-containing protein [Gomphosphaeria aponina SAG 52.96 = DSM 107014]